MKGNKAEERSVQFLEKEGRDEEANGRASYSGGQTKG